MLRNVLTRSITFARRSVSQKRHHQQQQKSGKWKKWTPLPVGVGVGYVAYQQYGHVIEREERKMGVVRETQAWKNWQKRVYLSIPWRLESRIWGKFCELHLPVFLRKPVIGFYARFFNCNVSEAEEEDIEKYATLNDFFRRSVKPALRPIADSLLIAPSDGVVQSCGEVTNGRIEQVKGYTYTLNAFLGDDMANQIIERQRQQKSKLLFCIVYLSPGDCHRFFAPTQWQIDFRRHFTGYLLSVNKTVITKFPELFSINERVLLTGKWKHGFFSMTPVAATHVGNIRLENDDTLRTNSSSKKIGTYDDKVYVAAKKNGDYVGEFNLGSSVVLIFEAPNEFAFEVKSGDKLKYGQKLGSMKK
jgi:phosphatidylserine decarboxylase